MAKGYGSTAAESDLECGTLHQERIQQQTTCRSPRKYDVSEHAVNVVLTLCALTAVAVLYVVVTSGTQTSIPQSLPWVIHKFVQLSSANDPLPAPSDIILIGDSVLDDFYYLESPRQDVAQQCRDTFGESVKVTNFAVDGSLTEHVLEGIRPDSVYVEARAMNGMDPYPVSIEDGYVYPLGLLQKYIDSESGKLANPIVVLSIGGNDARVHLQKLMTGDADDVIEALIEHNFVSNYQHIVKQLVTEYQLNVIVVFVYQIESSDVIYASKSKVEELLKVMEFGFTEISKVAEEYKLPIIDLSRTYDPTNPNHYGSDPIEPSNMGGQLTVNLIRFVTQKYDFGDENRKSKVFYGLDGSVTVEENMPDEGAYLKSIMERNRRFGLID